MHTKLSLLRKFLETTTIKGVPHTYKSKGHCFRVLWGSSVLLGFSVATYFLIDLFILYFNHTTTTSISQIRDGHMFPAITLCNLNNLANTGIRENDIYEYYHMIMDDNSTWSTREMQYMELLMSPSSIFENLIYGRPNERTQDFIVACRWNEGFLYDEDLCKDTLKRVMYTTSRGYCYTFRPPEQLARISAFSAIVYVGNTVDVILPSYDMSVAAPYSSGALLALHHRDIPPDLTKGFALEVGHDTSIKLLKSRTVRIKTPKDECIPISQNDKPYNRDICIQGCFQEHIIGHCGCVDGRLDSTEHRRSVLDFCGDISQPNSTLTDFIERMQCLDELMSMDALCDVSCPEMCYDEELVLTSSKVPWPHPSYQLSLHGRYIRQQPYSRRFDAYVEVNRLAQTDPMAAFAMLEQMSLLEKNFLQVSQPLRW